MSRSRRYVEVDQPSLTTLTVVQPTGGVILVHDTQPSEPKDLLELKIKKAVTTAAPGPGQTLGSGPAGATGIPGLSNLPAAHLEGLNPTQRQVLGDLQRLLGTPSRSGLPSDREPRTPAFPGDLGGAAAGAGVLTAWDEGEEDAEVPGDFEYESDGYRNDGMDEDEE